MSPEVNTECGGFSIQSARFPSLPEFLCLTFHMHTHTQTSQSVGESQQLTVGCVHIPQLGPSTFPVTHFQIAPVGKPQPVPSFHSVH